MERKRFSWKERGNSFTYAWSGLKALMRTEHNAWIHLALTIAAVASGFILKISKGEFLAIIIVMTIVWMAEILNTAVEKTMDFISLEKHPQIKLVKDLAAAAVLITAFAALLVGAIIFIPKILEHV
ncbi:MAG: diacylglycerol kinase [Flavisolibacter sp.]|jgi:diacylglycerol kinase